MSHDSAINSEKYETILISESPIVVNYSSLFLKNLVQSFLDKEQDVDEFLSEFLSKRKTAHLRRIKAEKITGIISQQNSSSHSTPYPVPPSAGGGLGYGGSQWGTPYPTQPLNMPLPGFH